MARRRGGKSQATFKDDGLEANLRGYSDEVDRAIKFIMEYHATAGQAKMKEDAPWTDRTSAARNGLFTVTEFGRGHYRIVFAHSVHYGIWLEVKFSGRDAVIMPTVISQGRELMKDLRSKIT